MEKTRLTHANNHGKATMVNIEGKTEVKRKAVASGEIILSQQTVALIKENNVKKGDVLTLAEVAGIQAAKRTSELIPLCHPILLTSVNVNATLKDSSVVVVSTVQCIGRTGVEMEALTAVSIALLTIYDMCKAVDKNMIIKDIELVKKEKGE